MIFDSFGYGYSGPLEMIIGGFLLLIATTLFAIFSPFGIGFAIFSIIREKTKNSTLKRTSFVFQIILSAITLILGLIFSIMFFVRGSPLYIYGNPWIPFLAVFFGIFFVFAIELGITIWQSTKKSKKR